MIAKDRRQGQKLFCFHFFEGPLKSNEKNGQGFLKQKKTSFLFNTISSLKLSFSFTLQRFHLKMIRGDMYTHASSWCRGIGKLKGCLRRLEEIGLKPLMEQAMSLCPTLHGRLDQVFHLNPFLIRVFALLLITIFISSCSDQKSKIPPQNNPLPVTVSTAIQKAVPIQLRAIGNVQAYSAVSIKTLVEGEIVRVYFTEGQDVKKGDFLFKIDPRPFEAGLKQAEANLERDMAQVKQAEADLEKNVALVRQAEGNLERDTAQAKNAEIQAQRYEFLLEKKVVAREQYEQLRTNAEALQATVRADKAAKESAEAGVQASKAGLENAKAMVQADKAAVENVKIQLGYCSIYAPMEGRTGSLLVQQGNVVKANDIPLVVINQMTPIYVTFSVPEQDLPEIKRYMATQKLKVGAITPNDENHPEEGVLTFIDNAVDSTTGTIRLKGTFGNKEKRLWPGQFINVILTLSIQPDAIVIPSQAVQTGQEGPYVFVVNPDFSVESRPVVVNRTNENEMVIEKGLKRGEMAVTDGHLRLYPGARVEIKNSSASPKGRVQ